MPIIIGILITLLLAGTAVVVYLLAARRDLAARVQSREADLAAFRSAITTLEHDLESQRNESTWYQTLFTTTRDLVLVFSPGPDGMPGPFLDVNDAACERLKYSREELMKLTLANIEAGEGPANGFGYNRSDLVVLTDDYLKQRQNKYATRIFRTFMDRVLASGNLSVEQEFEDRNGERFPVLVHARTLQTGSTPVIVLTVLDVTEQKRAEQRLTESEQRFRKFFQDSPIGIAIYDNQRNLMDVNRACLKIFGIPDMTEFTRFNLFDNPFIPPDIQAKLNAGENVRYESVIDFSDVLSRSLFITTRSGTAYLDVLIHNMGNDKTFHPRGFFAQVQDLSDRRHTEQELQKREKQLLQAEKMEAIGSMAGGIAHDFNNILTPIIGYAALVSRLAKGSDDLCQFAGNIERAAHRAKDLVMQILTFSRKGEGDDEPVQPTCVIPIAKEVLNLHQTTLPENIRIERNIKTEQDVVMASATALHQVLMNLCTNAIHAMKSKGGILEMRLTDYHIKDPTRSDTPDLPAGHYLRISIRDTGTGIEKQLLNRIFEPFFTTKPKGEGTGMGLAVVLGIIKRLKGAITVESEIGAGTVFHVILPLMEGAALTASQSESELPQGSGSILVVDDDADILQMAGDMLKSLGYEPVTINQPFGALKIFNLQPARFAAVIVDQSMPAMSGIQFTGEIRKIRPDIPVILCSGYQSVDEDAIRSAGINDLLPKPIIMDDLAVKLHRLLAESTQAGLQPDR